MMVMIIGELQTPTLHEVFELCKKYNVSEFKLGDLHIKMSEVHQISPIVMPNTSGMASAFKDPLQNPMTEDEILFWSSGGAEFKNTKDEDVPVPLVGEEIQK